MSLNAENYSVASDMSADRIQDLVSQRIAAAYFADDRPWVIGYSGGKDSTFLLQAVYRWISETPRAKRIKPVHVLACDTRVELPSMTAHIEGEMERVAEAAKRDELPVHCQIITPDINDTFWVNLLGRGYPSPTIHFRWCTERLKILPVSRFIQRVIDRSGSVNILLGVRADESVARARSLERYEAGAGTGFRPHTDLRNAWVVAPIHDFLTADVWTYLNDTPCPWGGTNNSLRDLYLRAGGTEPPLPTERAAKPVGPSRFGCWTCTVVEKDQMTAGLIATGECHFKPLLEYRDLLRHIREQPGARYDFRRNGVRPIHRDTGEAMTNTGPFTHETRMQLLDRLLETQRAAGVSLIGADELEAIQEVWDREEQGHPEKPQVSARAVERIWRQAEEGEIMTDEAYASDLTEEDGLLEDVCQRMDVPVDLMLRLRSLEEEFGRLRRRHGLPAEMREIIRDCVLQSEGD